MLAAQGYELDDDDPQLARAYAGATLQLEAVAEVKGLRRDIFAFMQALAKR